MNWMLRIIKSCFALPRWVFIWVFFVLIPANLSGIFLLQYEAGFWVAIFGTLGMAVNVPILWMNGGMSKVLAIPHLIFWIPLHFILMNRLLSGLDISEFEQIYMIVMLAINTISLLFDINDANEWRKGSRGVTGFEGEKVWL